MDWKELYRQKLTTADEAVKRIKSGDRVVVTHATGESTLLSDAMVRNASAYRDVEIVHLSLIHISSPRDAHESRMASSA